MGIVVAIESINLYLAGLVIELALLVVYLICSYASLNLQVYPFRLFGDLILDWM